MIYVYRVLTNILYPVIVLLIYFRKLINKEDKLRYKEKIFPSDFNIKKENKKKLLWFHAASVGELKSILPLIEKLNNERADIYFLITTTTLSSASLANEEFKQLNNISHRFFPVDVHFLIKKFISSWKPKYIFLVDSEIWPNLIIEAANNKIPLALINARITNKTFKRWKIFPNTAKKIFNLFDLYLSSNNETKKYLSQLCTKEILDLGNLKLFNNFKNKKINNINHKILEKKIFWLASSTHKGEEAFCIDAHLKIKTRIKEIVTIIAPRHLNRVHGVKKLCENFNLKSQILNKGELIEKDKEIIIINSYGDLQNFYKYCSSVFMGKSMGRNLFKVGGQSPIEPAQLGCRVYHGPYVYNFQEIYKMLNNNKISQLIKNSEELVANIIYDLEKQNLNKDSFSNFMNDLGQRTFLDTLRVINQFIK